MAKKILFVTILEKSTKNLFFLAISKIELIPSPVIKFCDGALDV